MTRVGRIGQFDVAFGDAAHGRVNDAHLYFVGVGIGDGLLQRLDRALHVGLDDQVDRLDIAGLHRVEEVVQRDLALAGQCGVASLQLPLLGDAAGFVDVFHDENLSPADGNSSRPLTTTGVDGPAS